MQPYLFNINKLAHVETPKYESNVNKQKDDGGPSQNNKQNFKPHNK